MSSLCHWGIQVEASTHEGGDDLEGRPALGELCPSRFLQICGWDKRRSKRAAIVPLLGLQWSG